MTHRRVRFGRSGGTKHGRGVKCHTRCLSQTLSRPPNPDPNSPQLAGSLAGCCRQSFGTAATAAAAAAGSHSSSLATDHRHSSLHNFRLLFLYINQNVHLRPNLQEEKVYRRRCLPGRTRRVLVSSIHSERRGPRSNSASSTFR